MIMSSSGQNELLSSSHALPSSTSTLPSSLLDCHSAENCDSIPLCPEFTFETDHEALRGNNDYLALLKTFSVLQAQRVQAVKDVDSLLEARERCLRDPLGMLDKLQRGEGLGIANLPQNQVIAELPDIDWDKYSLVGVRAGSKKPETRNKGKINSNGGGEVVEKASNDSAKMELTAKGQILVRGRVFEEGKPRTFNQPWTPEEQQRLEELLLRFPSEEVEMERWKKIAAALGNRTAIQVQSRTQKYFLKLQKAGLPIPGRQLKSRHRAGIPVAASGIGAGAQIQKPATVTRSGRQVMKTAKNSSFFPALHPAVKMTEEDEDNADGGMSAPSSSSYSVFQDPLPASRTPILNDGYYLEEEDVSDEEGVDERLRSTAEYQELMWLKRVRRERELEQQRPGGPMVHSGFRCDGCDVSPIVGGRFQCVECLAPDTIDFCCECAPKGLEVSGGRHDKSHALRPVRKKAAVDQEYWVVNNAGYLDPNFVR